MDDSFMDLHPTMYTTEGEFQRFRELIVNMVMATDIMDKEINNERKDCTATRTSLSDT